MPPNKNSEPPKSWLPVAGGIIFVGVIGFIAGRHSVAPQIIEREKIVAVTQTSAVPLKPDAPAMVEIKAVIPAPTNNFWDESRWRELDGQLGTPARNQMLAALLEKLAATDPQKAMALAEAEANLKLRAELEQAVLRGWATTAPLAAAGWALALTDEPMRNQSIATILASAVATNPSSAIQFASQLCAQHPSEATVYGSGLISALNATGNFELAAQFAAQGADTSRPIWLADVYSQWAGLQPEQAAQAAGALTDPDARRAALNGLALGWAEANPAGLAQFALQLPADGTRGQMLNQALNQWARVDAVAATTWINNNYQQLGGDSDSSIATIATASTLPPQTATVWADAISDPARRSETLSIILQNWVHSDPAAARQFFSTTQNLLPADREQISAAITGINPQPQP
jgi:hypothetical protein